MSFTASPPFVASRPASVPVRAVTVADIRASLRAGFDDFMAMPTHVLFLVLIYPVIGIVIARVTTAGERFGATLGTGDE